MQTASYGHIEHGNLDAHYVLKVSLKGVHAIGTYERVFIASLYWK